MNGDGLEARNPPIRITIRNDLGQALLYYKHHCLRGLISGLIISPINSHTKEALDLYGQSIGNWEAPSVSFHIDAL